MRTLALCALVAMSGLGFGCAAPNSGTAAAPLSRAQIEAIVGSPERSDADRRNDVRRKPVEMLSFIGVRPGWIVLDVSAGGGYTTELLARAVAPDGVVYGQSAPRNPGRAPPVAPEGGAATGAAPMSATAASAPPPRSSAMAVGERAKKPGTGHIVAVVQPFENPAPAPLAMGGFDLVTLMFNYHDLGHLGVDRARMNAALFAALKPGGLYVIADHAGRPGTGIGESGTLHRVEEALVRREVEAAGFRFIAAGSFLRNPADPRDRNEPDPPQPKDEFVLKFVKP
jgi:predicted methyltransferase